MPDKLGPAQQKRKDLRESKADERRRLAQTLDRLEKGTPTQNRKEELRKWRNALQRQLDRTKGRLKDVARRIKLLKKKDAGSLHDIVGFDNTPTFRMHALWLQDCREHGWSGILSSAIRWNPPCAEFGKKDQETLYNCYRNCVPSCQGDCLPANPPTQGTHLLLGDGTAYGKPVGAKLPDNELGHDVSMWDQLVAVSRSLGYDVRQPYSSGSEAHHVNCYNDVSGVLRKRGIVT